MNFPRAPSFFTLVITGILMLVIIGLVIKHFKSIRSLDFYKLITLMAVVSIAIGNHGLIHLGMEQAYGFNPII